MPAASPRETERGDAPKIFSSNHTAAYSRRSRIVSLSRVSPRRSRDSMHSPTNRPPLGIAGEGILLRDPRNVARVKLAC